MCISLNPDISDNIPEEKIIRIVNLHIKEWHITKKFLDNMQNNYAEKNTVIIQNCNIKEFRLDVPLRIQLLNSTIERVIVIVEPLAFSVIQSTVKKFIDCSSVYDYPYTIYSGYSGLNSS